MGSWSWPGRTRYISGVTRTARESTLIVFLFCWVAAVLLSWMTPDTGPWGGAQWTFYAASAVALVVFTAGLVRARRRRDPTARLDARIAFGIGAVASGLCGLAVDHVLGRGDLPTFIFLGGLWLSGYAYLRVAERAWS